MPGRFTHRVALITGGGSGIGRAAAQAFAREGATVVVAGRRLDTLTETVAAITADGGNAHAHPTDVTKPEEVEHLVHETVARHGGLHIALNNAGAVTAGALADIDDDAWARLLAVNVTGVFLTMKHEIRHMRTAGGGVIVNTASNIGAHQRRASMAAYAATKAAVSALTRGAALDHIGHGIRINAISPGPMDTAMSLRPGETSADRAKRLQDTNPATPPAVSAPSTKRPPRSCGCAHQSPASLSDTTSSSTAARPHDRSPITVANGLCPRRPLMGIAWHPAGTMLCRVGERSAGRRRRPAVAARSPGDLPVISALRCPLRPPVACHDNDHRGGAITRS
jgi:NAD(P)-dependent dehydrogenase (short-subunit alcohol dehydrogenase family)